MRCLSCLSGVILVAAAAVAEAQDPATSAPPRGSAVGETPKSVTTARLIGVLLPGFGHFYAGEPGRGLAYIGGLAGIATIAGAMLADCDSGYSVVGNTPKDPDCAESSATAGIAAIALFGVWGWSIYDAGKAARRTNAKRGLGAAAIIVDPFAAPSTLGGRAIGVRIGASVTLP